MPVAKASSPAASGAETCQKAYEANEPAPIAPVTASHTERRSASLRSLEAPSASRDTAPPACEQATRSPAPIVGPRPCARTTLMRGARRSGGRRVVEPAERAPAQRDRQGHHEAARRDRRPPSKRGGHAREHERRGDPAQGEPHLLDAHRDAALVSREEIHDGLAERGIDDAPTDAGQEQAQEERREARRQRADREPRRADDQSPEQARPRAQTVGEPSARQREEEAADIDRRNDERDLKSCQAEARDEAWREGRDPEHPEG